MTPTPHDPNVIVLTRHGMIPRVTPCARPSGHDGACSAERQPEDGGACGLGLTRLEDQDAAEVVRRTLAVVRALEERVSDLERRLSVAESASAVYGGAFLAAATQIRELIGPETPYTGGGGTEPLATPSNGQTPVEAS